MAKNYTAEQVADMIMNDDIEEMDSTDSLDEESSSSSSNDEPSSQSEVDSSSIILTLSFVVGESLSKNLVRNLPSKCAKTREGISNHGRTIRTRGGISKQSRISEQEQAFQTVGKKP